MRRDIRRKLDMAEGARDFLRQHPPTTDAQLAIVARLDQLLKRAESLSIAERAGRLEQHAAANRRRELRRSVKVELLYHLVRVGQLAAEDRPELAGKFHLRSPDATHRSFLISTRQMLGLAVDNKDLFVSKGLAEPLLSELGGIVAQFEEATTTGRNGRSEHIRARAEQEDVVAELVRTVDQLTGIIRYQFRGSPDIVAAWEAIRVIGPRSRPEPAPEGPSGGGVAPPAGGVAPAA